MINRDRVLKLLRDFKEWEEDFKLASIKLEECEDAENIKFIRELEEAIKELDKE